MYLSYLWSLARRFGTTNFISARSRSCFPYFSDEMLRLRLRCRLAEISRSRGSRTSRCFFFYLERERLSDEGLEGVRDRFFLIYFFISPAYLIGSLGSYLGNYLGSYLGGSLVNLDTGGGCSSSLGFSPSSNRSS
jgi:hypothetical protein